MLHEVVITLLGKSSSLLRSLDTYVDLKPFLHTHENELINKILVIAKDFKILQDFIKRSRSNIHGLVKVDNIIVTPGLYIQALAEAIDRALNPYRQEVISLEQEVLSESSVTLIYIWSRMEIYRNVISALCCFIQDVIAKKIHGCKLLQLLYDASITSTDDIKCCIDYILQQCHRVLLKQVSSWILNGYLIDPYNEFFITSVVPEKSELFSICADDASESAIQYRSTYNEELKCVEYMLVAEYIPTYISYSLVNDILFIGRIVLILNKNPKFKNALTGGLNQFVFKNREMELYRNFESFSKNQSFDVADLEKPVWEIKSYVVEYLWKVAVEEHRLFEELQLMKNVYLLGQADLFIELLKKFDVFIKVRSSKIFIKKLNCYLKESDYITQLLDWTTIEKFNFYLTRSNSDDATKSSTSKRDAWSSIMLEYKTCWPLNLLFTKNVMLRYNKLFTFLLRIRKCHLDIHQVWFKEVKNKSTRQFELSWKLRNELMFLISNLQFYLQVDVIEAEYKALTEILKEQKDFQQMIKSHHLFLLNVLNQSFIFCVQAVDGEEDLDQLLSHIKPHKIYIILMEIFQVCEKFCAIMMKDNMHETQKMKEYRSMMNHLSLLRSALINALLALQFQPFRGNLSKLLLRLDMNCWSTRNSVLPLDSR